MSVLPLSTQRSASSLPLEQLAKNPDVSDKEKVKMVSQQFEAYLLRNFITEARKPLVYSNSALGGGSQQIYQDMVTEQMAENISKSGSFGLGTLLQSQLERQNLAPEAPKPTGTQTEMKR